MALTTVPASMQDATAQYNGFKNRIINGAMVIDQRNAGASFTPVNDQFITDRFQSMLTQTSKVTSQQSTTAPAGFINSLLVTSSSAYSVVSGDFFGIRQCIEGLNMTDFGWGASGASTVTLSFWVRSSLTGTFGGSIFNGGGNRSYPFSYTISAANTWEQKSITIAGDITGTWTYTNGKGLQLAFGLGVGTTYSGTAGSWSGNLYISATGATSVVGTSGATFYITGVQLEKGSTATGFDYRAWNVEKYLCERYCQTTYPYGTAPGTNIGFSGIVGRTGMQGVNGTGEIYQCTQFKQQMRASPTISFYDAAGTAGKVTFTNYAVTDTNNISGSVGQSSMNGMGITANTTGYGGSSYHYLVTAEL